MDYKLVQYATNMAGYLMNALQCVEQPRPLASQHYHYAPRIHSSAVALYDAIAAYTQTPTLNNSHVLAIRTSQSKKLFKEVVQVCNFMQWPPED